jgi:hypothetical protein
LIVNIPGVLVEMSVDERSICGRVVDIPPSMLTLKVPKEGLKTTLGVVPTTVWVEKPDSESCSSKGLAYALDVASGGADTQTSGPRANAARVRSFLVMAVSPDENLDLLYSKQ